MGTTQQQHARTRSIRLSSLSILLSAAFSLVLLCYLYRKGPSASVVVNLSHRHRIHGGVRNVLNSTLGFQKLLVINLPYRTDRRDAISLSAVVSNLKLEFVDGVPGKGIPDHVLPPGKNRLLEEGIKGSWRAHMNVLRKIVEENITSALIFEDDMDWDIRLPSQLQSFALASQILVEDADEPMSRYDVQETDNEETEEIAPKNMSYYPIPETLYTIPLDSAARNRRHRRPSNPAFPYGDPDKWDVMWLGHCGVGFPRPAIDNTSTEGPKSQSRLRDSLLGLPNDLTVPEPKYIKAHPFANPDAFAKTHPPHTRVYHHAKGGAFCSVAYGVSQRGARRLLHQFGLKEWNMIYDIELGIWCARSDLEEEEHHNAELERLGFKANTELNSEQGNSGFSSVAEKEKARRKLGERVCITSQPPIFGQYRGGESDIGGFAGGLAKAAETKYIRWSVRKNLERLIRGEKELVDQWPDTV